VETIGPFVVNPRSDKVHRSTCHFVSRAPYSVKPLTIEATTTDEARDRIRELGLAPCDHCLPFDGGLGHGQRIEGELMPERGQRYAVRHGHSESEEIEEPWQIVDTETDEVVDQFERRRDAGTPRGSGAAPWISTRR